MSINTQKQAFEIIESLIADAIEEMELPDFLDYFCNKTGLRFCQQLGSTHMSYWFESDETELVAEPSVEKAVARALVHLIDTK